MSFANVRNERGIALVVAIAGGVVAVTQQRRADAASLLADARRLGAQALVEQDLRRAMLLAVAATKLDTSWLTTGNLLAAVNRSPRLLRISGVGGGERLLSLAVSPDGRTIAVSTNSQRVHIYDASTLKLTAKLDTELAVVNHLSFTPDGRQLLGLGGQESNDGHGLQLWSVDTWRSAGEPFGPSSYARGENVGGGCLPMGTRSSRWMTMSRSRCGASPAVPGSGLSCPLATTAR